MTADEHWALWRADPRATPFQSPAWLEAWWEHLGGAGERRDVVARDGSGRPIAALPAWVWRDGDVRRLTPVGAGISDYCDALVDPAAPGAVEALWAEVGCSDEWDEVLLPDLRPDSPLLGRLPAGLAAEDSPMETCPVLAIPEHGDVLRALTKSQRRKIVHDHHRAERLGGVEAGFATGGAVPEAMDALYALHAARWAIAGEPGVLADPRVQAFHRAVARALDAAGLLRLAVVRHEGRIVAVLHGFCDRARGYSYINGVDLAVPGQSFGTLAFRAAIERAAAEGAREFHFLRGEEPYKYAWGAEPRRTMRRVMRRAGTGATIAG